MAKKSFAQALAQRNAAPAANLTAMPLGAMTDEEIRKKTYEARIVAGNGGADKLARANMRADLMRRAGYDFFDVRSLVFNEGNAYSIDEDSIATLADMIYASKVTEPIVIRAIDEGLQVIDGERRCRAHMLLAERHGDEWYMIPGRCFKAGEVSDDDARFILHATNVGQRNMTPSERAMGFAAVAERIAVRKAAAPQELPGKTRDILAAQMGVSPRTAAIEMAIGRNLGDAGKRLYDDGAITKAQAEQLSHLGKPEQEAVAREMERGEADFASAFERASEAAGAAGASVADARAGAGGKASAGVTGTASASADAAGTGAAGAGAQAGADAAGTGGKAGGKRPASLAAKACRLLEQAAEHGEEVGPEVLAQLRAAIDALEKRG